MSRKIAVIAAVCVTALVVAAPGIPAAKDGRTLSGIFGDGTDTPCGSSPAARALYTISLTEGGQAATDLRPGVYWLQLNDNCANHGFGLVSPSSDADPLTDGTTLTQTTDVPGIVTLKMNLRAGTYKLYCTNKFHPNMFTTFTVSGVGQDVG